MNKTSYGGEEDDLFVEKWRYEKVVFLIYSGVCFVLLRLRSPYAGDSCDARYVDRCGDGSVAFAFRGIFGVRPASVI